MYIILSFLEEKENQEWDEWLKLLPASANEEWSWKCIKIRILWLNHLMRSVSLNHCYGLRYEVRLCFFSLLVESSALITSGYCIFNSGVWRVWSQEQVLKRIWLPAIFLSYILCLKKKTQPFLISFSYILQHSFQRTHTTEQEELKAILCLLPEPWSLLTSV